MLLPYASDRPPKNPPLTVVCLVLFHFLVFGVSYLLIATGHADSVVWLYANLGLVPGQLHLYSPITYSVLHDSVAHLSVNMLFLWVFGGSVEDALGWRRFASLYVSAAVITGMLQVGMTFLVPDADRLEPIIGASGAVAALMGVFAVRFYRSRIRFIGLPWRVPAIALLGAVLVGEMGFALLELLHRNPSGVTLAAHWAHVGGFLLGIGLAQATRMFHAAKQEYLATDATRAMDQGAPLSAVHRWEAVLEAQPDNLYAQGELARALAAADDLELAREAYRQAIEGLLKRGDRRGAADRYVEMLSAVPGELLPPAAQLAVATALEEQQLYAGAFEALNGLRERCPDAPEAEMALLRAANLAARRLGLPREARGLLADFLRRYPESAHRAFAENLLQTLPGGDTDEA